MLSILLIPAALCFTFGRSIKIKKQGIAIFAAMFICLVAALAVIGRSEQMAVPQLAQDGMVDISEVSQAGGQYGRQGDPVRYSDIGDMGCVYNGSFQWLCKLHARQLYANRRYG